MKIAILVDDSRDGRTALERSFLWRGLKAVLTSHEPVVLIASEYASLTGVAENYDYLVSVGNACFDGGMPRWKVDELRHLGGRFIPYGLCLSEGLVSGDWASEIHSLFSVFAQQGEISVADSATQEILKTKAKKLRSTLTGLPAIFSEAEPLLRRESRYLFFPGFEAAEPQRPAATNTVVRKLYGHFAARQKTLFCALRPEDLILGAEPGLDTLYQPHFSELYSRAIASSAAVVTFRILPALVAVAHGVPAVYVGRDPWSKSIAAALDLPVVEFHPESDPLDVHHRVDERLKKFPWDRVSAAIQTLRKSSLHYLMERGLSVDREMSRKKRLARAGGDSQTLHICSVADGRYFPFVAGMIENLAAVHGANLQFHFLALDKRAEARADELARLCSVKTYSLSDLWQSDELPTILSRSNGFRAFSSKPRFLDHVLARVNDTVIYADADVYFFSSPDYLRDEFGTQSVLLFPHWNDDPVASRRDGLFNAGIIAVRPGAKTFLGWWAERCLERCEFDWQDGIVGDQGYLDFAPVFFEEVRVYRKADQNVARWNMSTLGVTLPSEGTDTPRLFDGSAVRSYHAAFADECGLFEAKVGWDQLVHFFSDANAKRETGHLFGQVIQQQREHWMGLARWINAYRWSASVFGWDPEVPNARLMRFFVQGAGRHLLNLALIASGRSRYELEPMQAASEPKLNAWQKAQRERLLERKSSDVKRAPTSRYEGEEARPVATA